MQEKEMQAKFIPKQTNKKKQSSPLLPLPPLPPPHTHCICWLLILIF